MNCACKQSVIPRLGVKRRGALPFFSPSVVGRHAARELTHLAGGLPRSVSPDRRFPSAARFGGVPSVQFIARRSSCLRSVARNQRRVRGHRSVTGQASTRQDHPATSTITPHRAGLVLLAARSRRILRACVALASAIPASALSVPSMARERTRGTAFPLRVAFRRAPVIWDARRYGAEIPRADGFRHLYQY